MNWDNFEIQVKTFFDLEEVLAQEIKQLGGSNIEIKNRAVVCTGDLFFLYKLNYSLRTALKINVPIFSFVAKTPEMLYDECYHFPWEKYLAEDQDFYIDYTVFSEIFTHSQFAMLKLKDAIVDRFKDKFHKRPSVAMDEKAIKFHLHIQNEKVTISLDSSGEPLYKRGYRTATTEAPINEVLAAGMLALSTWNAGANLLDPMCGSGTILIEAAMLAYQIPSQINRNYFAFMNWKNFSPEKWQKVKEIRQGKMKEFLYEIVGYDISDKALAACNENIRNAGLEEIIKIEKKDFFESKKDLAPLWLMMNPPYNERLAVEDEFYPAIGDTLKHNYPYCICWIISAEENFEKKIGLKTSRKIKLYNGKLECKFVQYETYEGSKKNKQA